MTSASPITEGAVACGVVGRAGDAALSVGIGPCNAGVGSAGVGVGAAETPDIMVNCSGPAERGRRECTAAAGGGCGGGAQAAVAFEARTVVAEAVAARRRRRSSRYMGRRSRYWTRACSREGGARSRATGRITCGPLPNERPIRPVRLGLEELAGEGKKEEERGRDFVPHPPCTTSSASSVSSAPTRSPRATIVRRKQLRHHSRWGAPSRTA